MKKVFIILLNWNGWRDTVQCLESIMCNVYRDFSVVVCDNNSEDDSLEHIKSWAEGRSVSLDDVHVTLKNYVKPSIEKPLNYEFYNAIDIEKMKGDENEGADLVLIQTGSNRGFSGGNNVGIRYALKKKASYIWLLNNDTIIKPDALEHLIQTMEQNPKAGLAGSVIYFADEPSRIQTYGGGKLAPCTGTDRFLRSKAPVDYVAGTSLFIRRDVVETIGLLDENFFFYWEDVDYSTRAVKAGWDLIVADESVVYHKFSNSVGSQSLKSDILKVRAMKHYFKKHRKLWLFPVGFNITGMLINRFFRGQMERLLPIFNEAIS